jgi:hypothetical protein
MKRVKIVKIHPRDAWYDCRDILEGKTFKEYQGNLYAEGPVLKKLKWRGFENPIVLSEKSETEEAK